MCVDIDGDLGLLTATALSALLRTIPAFATVKVGSLAIGDETTIFDLPPSRIVRAIAQYFGYDLSDHRSQQLSRAKLVHYDTILCTSQEIAGICGSIVGLWTPIHIVEFDESPTYMEPDKAARILTLRVQRIVKQCFP